MQKSPGHTLSEYGLVGALIAISCLGSLALLGHAIQGQFQQISNAPDPGDILKPIAAPAMTFSAAVTGPAPPAVKPAANATSFIDYKAIASSVQTAGANGTTKILADNITKLAQDQLAAGQITEAQANTIFALANQAYHLAQIESSIENIANSSNLTRSDFGQQTVTLDGKQTTIDDLMELLGYTQSYRKGLLSDPLNSMQYAKPETSNFLTLYNQAQASGALNDPIIKAQVQASAIQIATISDVLVFGAGDDRDDNIRDNISLSDSMATRLTDFNGSASAATTQDGNNICTTGNGKVSKGHSNHCSG